MKYVCDVADGRNTMRTDVPTIHIKGGIAFTWYKVNIQDFECRYALTRGKDQFSSILVIKYYDGLYQF